MSVENLANAAVETAMPVASDDDQLGAIWDQVERDNGAARAEDGKFRSPNAEASTAPKENAEITETPLEGEGGGEDGEKTDSTPVVSTAPLPANWVGSDGKIRPDLEAIWNKLPPEDQQTLSRQQTDLHSRMSEQGRQIGALRPLNDVVERHRDLLEGRTLQDGSPVSPQAAIDFLFTAQRKLEADPASALIEIADTFGARDQLIAALVAAGSGQQRQPNPTPRQSAGLTPAQIEEMVNSRLDHRLSEDAALRAAEAELDRLSKDKPFYAEIPESKMVNFILMSREDLGDAASPEAVFSRAYDMAVNADPILRAKAAAVNAPQPKPAAQTDPKKTAGAKLAASVNVTSTKAGAPRKLSEDDELSGLYDELKAS